MLNSLPVKDTVLQLRRTKY